jgi:hypothetical protein
MDESGFHSGGYCISALCISTGSTVDEIRSDSGTLEINNIDLLHDPILFSQLTLRHRREEELRNESANGDR